VETLVAVAILGIAIVAFVVALSTGAIAVGGQDEATAAQGLAQSQLEYIKSQPYSPGSYATVAAPAGYALSVAVAPVPGTDTDIQKVTVTVLRDGDGVLTVSDYKVNR